MPLRYIRPKESTVQPLDLQLADTILGRRQKRQDQSIAQQEAALQEALSRGFMNQSDREQFETSARNRFAEVAQKYKGDLSAGYKEMLGAVTDVRTDPFHQTNQKLMEQAQIQQKMQVQYGQDAYVQNDLFKQSVYDEQGNLRNPNSFQANVLNLQDFQKQGALMGTNIASSMTSDFTPVKGAPGYIERQTGYKDTESAANFMSEEGQEYITDYLESRGLDASDERLRNSVGQGMMGTLVGDKETKVDKNFISAYQNAQLDLADRRLELSRDEFEARKTAQDAKNRSNDIKTGKGKIRDISDIPQLNQENVLVQSEYPIIAKKFSEDIKSIKDNLQSKTTETQVAGESFVSNNPNIPIEQFENMMNSYSNIGIGEIDNETKKLLSERKKALEYAPGGDKESLHATIALKSKDNADKLTEQINARISKYYIPMLEEDSKYIDIYSKIAEEGFVVNAPKLSNNIVKGFVGKHSDIKDGSRVHLNPANREILIFNEGKDTPKVIGFSEIESTLTDAQKQTAKGFEELLRKMSPILSDIKSFDETSGTYRKGDAEFSISPNTASEIKFYIDYDSPIYKNGRNIPTTYIKIGEKTNTNTRVMEDDYQQISINKISDMLGYSLLGQNPIEIGLKKETLN